MKYLIQYVSRRRFLAGVRAGLDLEDQPWIVAVSETVEGTEAQADEHAQSLDRDTDGEFVHRAVPVPAEPEDLELAPLAKCTHCPGPVGAAGWEGICSPCWATIEHRMDERRRAS
jgi:hypothetical protein